LALALLGAGAFFIGCALFIPAKAALAQMLLERAWARVQSGEPSVKPWSWADISPVAEIEIPRLHRRAIVLEGSSGEALAFGPGHMPNTPMIGEAGTAIVAAHRDTQFRFLGELKLGDAISATTTDGRRISYRVVAMRVVQADASGLDPQDKGPTGSRLALVTCYPFSGVLHSPLRYVVLAEKETEADKRAAAVH
jgi:sortase A